MWMTGAVRLAALNMEGLMATARITVATVLGTVSATAEAVTDVVNTVGTLAKMGNDYVKNAQYKQRIQMALSEVGMEKLLRNERMIEINDATEKADNYIAAGDVGRAERCEKIFAELDEALEKVRAKRD
jgi:hypothetical protein